MAKSIDIVIQRSYDHFRDGVKVKREVSVKTNYGNLLIEKTGFGTATISLTRNAEFALYTILHHRQIERHIRKGNKLIKGEQK